MPNGDRVLPQGPSAGLTGRAGLIDDPSPARTLRARDYLADQQRAVAAGHGQLAGPAAARAAARSGARPGSAARARRAWARAADRDFLCPAGQHLLQGDDQVQVHVLAALRARHGRPEQPLEQAAECGRAGPEDIGEVDAAPQVLCGRPGQASGPLRVVARSLGRIGQHAIGFGDLLEPLLRVRLGAGVGVIAAGQLAERVLDGLDIGITRDPEHLVVVTRDGHSWPAAAPCRPGLPGSRPRPGRGPAPAIPAGIPGRAFVPARPDPSPRSHALVT